MRAVLVGNQNCGKSTLFNLLTGSNQKTGNWPGVTVSKKSGVINDLDMELIDLPGIYSMSPYSPEEKISYGYLLNEDYDLIINVVDSTSIERGLYLTVELLELHRNVIVVLNMMDKLKEKGIEIDITTLKECLGVDVCMLSASHGVGIVPLFNIIKNNIFNNNVKNSTKQCIKSDFEDERLIIKRYEQVDSICKKSIKYIKIRNNKNCFLDSIILNKFLAFPIFILVMFGVYYFSIDFFGEYFSVHIANLLNNIKYITGQVLQDFNVSEWVISLICNGIITGVGSILSFLPQISIIFLCTSFLESCGYMARVSFIFDKLLKKCGLNGKSLIPFILGTGCSVSGIISTKIIESEKERLETIITTPFIPCSAKLPIITLFTKYFFEKNYALIATSFYVLSILIVIISSIVLKKILNKKDEELYIFELPEYKMPNIKFLLKDLKEKIFEFVHKVGTTIFLASILIWFLLSFSIDFQWGVNIENSILAFFGEKIAWLFEPIIGVNSWQASVSAIQGLIAKEQVVSSMEIIAGLSGEFKNSFEIFSFGSPFHFFNSASAYAFVAFNLFVTPCIATVATMFKELKNIKYFLISIIYQLLTGWGVAVILFNTISLL